MKRFVLASLLILLCFTICIVENIYIHLVFNEIQQNLKIAKSDITYTTVVKNKWNDNRMWLSFFINHSSLDEISEEIDKLNKTAYLNEYEYQNTIRNINFLLQSIKETESINFDNMF